ncbi:pectinesterase [Genlisea aurea]|uniref:Pectinesterase n=1 Tax=Genlisea aurea TaxID=192259 RepID=S8DN48_9LAMI|nr:pectinesterase [Genlisea aurea]
MEYGRLTAPGDGTVFSPSVARKPPPRKSAFIKQIVLIVAAILTAASAAGAAVWYVNREKIGHHRRSPPPAMSRACGRTLYQELCFASLVDYPGSTSASDEDLVHISFNLTLQKFGRALYAASEIENLAMDPRVRSAYGDCLELLDDSVDLLSRSLSAVLRGGTSSAGDVVTWLSASMTNHDTCIQGFAELSGDVKNHMTSRLKDLSELVSNCLAIYASIARGFDIAGIPIQNRRRSLKHHDDEEKESSRFPVWLSRRDKMLLQIPGVAVRADVVVSADGTGTCKTIGEAIRLAPDYGNRRFIIYVRAGKYEEEFLKIGRKKTNVMLVGDGKAATVISGGKSVQDNITTFRTASFVSESLPGAFDS